LDQTLRALGSFEFGKFGVDLETLGRSEPRVRFALCLKPETVASLAGRRNAERGDYSPRFHLILLNEYA
jgi:hypothetical protein